MAYEKLGDLSRSIDSFKQNLTIATKIGDRREEAAAHWHLGLAYEKLGDLPRAIEAMQSCLLTRGFSLIDPTEEVTYLDRLRARLAAQQRGRGTADPDGGTGPRK